MGCSDSVGIKKLLLAKEDKYMTIANWMDLQIKDLIFYPFIMTSQKQKHNSHTNESIMIV